MNPSGGETRSRPAPSAPERRIPRREPEGFDAHHTRARTPKKEASAKSAPSPLPPAGEEERGPPSLERVRTDFWWVYEALGGRRALLEWGRENEKEFFRMFFQVFPKEAREGGDARALLDALTELAGEEA